MAGGVTTTGGATGAGTTGAGKPNEKPKPTPAWADTAAAPIRAAAKSIFIFIRFTFRLEGVIALHIILDAVSGQKFQ